MEINDIYIRDPFVFVENGVCYMVGTTDEACWGGKASGFLGYKSSDLVNFEGPFELFKQTENFWADENFWAPELHKYNGKYYLIASFKKQGLRRASQILVCNEPFGEYKPLSEPFTPKEWECLDATLYEENGKIYTVFSHEWQQCFNGEIVVCEMNSDLKSVKGQPEVLFRATESPWVVSYRDEGFVTDGPFLYRLKSGKLIMLWSSFCKSGYAMGMAVSSNGVMGPWEHVKEPLFDKDGGHGMVFDFNGKTYVSLHCPNEPHLLERPRFYEVEDTGEKLILK